MSFVDTIKAILTRLIFSLHGLIAIYRVVTLKKDEWFWYLATTIILLIFEGIFTLTIKKTQEWKWYIGSIPVIHKYRIYSFTIRGFYFKKA